MRRAVNREVQAKAEEALFADLQFVAHFFGVEDGGLLGRVADAALFGVNLDAGFQLGHFFAQVFQHDLAFDRVDVHADMSMTSSRLTMLLSQPV